MLFTNGEKLTKLVMVIRFRGGNPSHPKFYEVRTSPKTILDTAVLLPEKTYMNP